MIDTIPYNLNFKIGDNLREVPEFLGGYKKGITYLEEQAAQAANDEEKGKCLSTLGVLKRISGDPEASLSDFKNAADLFENCSNRKLALINELRIGVSYKFLNRHADAESVFAKLEAHLKANPRHKGLMDFIYHHRGKNEFEQGNHQKALSAFQFALKLRKSKGNKELINSTQSAISIVQKQLAKNKI